MPKYEPELGQMTFGNKWEEFEVPEEVGDMLYELSDKLLDNINESPVYGVEYSNDIFEMHKYYWGNCTCGFDEAENEWLLTHQHKENCFHIKYEKYKAELEAKGIKWFGETKEEYNRLMTVFAKENGYERGLHGIAVYCDCGYEQEYEEWIKFHDHKPDCPIVVPNFRYKPTGLAINWYKYIGRGMSANQEIDLSEFRKIIAHCEESAINDIKKATEAKRQQKTELKRWRKEKKSQGFICQDCINFLGETKDGKVICVAEPTETEKWGMGIEIIELTPTFRNYQTKCSHFLNSGNK